MSKTITVTPELASANILAFAAEGRLEQHKWHGTDGQGRAIACLLGSIDPKINAPEECPASLMPRWLARLTVRLFDRIPAARVLEYGTRYGQSVARWGELDAAAWERIRSTFIIGTLDDVLARCKARMGDRRPAIWDRIEPLFARLKALCLSSASYGEFHQLRADAYALRDEAWKIYWASRKAWSVAEAAVAEAAVAVAEAAAEAAVAVAVAVAEAAVAVAVAEAEAVAEAAVAVAVAVAEAVAVAVVGSSRYWAIRKAVYAKVYPIVKAKLDEVYGSRLDEMLPKGLDLFDRMLPADPVQLPVIENADVLFAAPKEQAA